LLGFAGSCRLLRHHEPVSVRLSQEHPTAGLFSRLRRGLPFDLIHAGSTALFLWLIAGPMTEKLQRMKRKYGLLYI
jgi:energy-coupling factor transport system substrate-specific component